MKPINKQWESLKNEYINKVEKALSSVKHPRRKEVLEDVRSHLDRRFLELESDQQTLENLQTIITEMGPASDYAELLEPQAVVAGQKSQKKYFLLFGLAAVVIVVAAILLPKSKSAQIKKSIVEGRREDKIDYPFVNDPAVLGAWKSVDFVETKKEFKPNRQSFKGEFFLNHLVFEENGDVSGNIFVWTKGLVINEDAKTASEYEIKKVDGSTYMFFEWKSGDYTIRHEDPSYYVLKKVPLDDVKSEAMFGETADIPPTSIIDENGYLVDKVDYPFVNDPQALGAWESVDFVKEIEDFEPGKKNYEGDLFIKELYLLENGETNWPWNWTKGHILSDDTDSKYVIKEIDNARYMFFEWKSSDYTMRRSKPSYYVLKYILGKAYVESRTTDKIDYPFVDDPQVIGTWKSVDIVEKIEDFNPSTKNFRWDLYLKEIIILENGQTEGPWSWTKGLLLHSGDKTASRYIIKEIDGSTYMFFEWKSGDYIFRGDTPGYYVLKKE